MTKAVEKAVGSSGHKSGPSVGVEVYMGQKDMVPRPVEKELCLITGKDTDP
ncbi:MAG: hypothetical protein IKT14_05555 [Clostridiales bacterium]|nr:hypothetical protein [Clostridiales bacterium]